MGSSLTVLQSLERPPRKPLAAPKYTFFRLRECTARFILISLLVQALGSNRLTAGESESDTLVFFLRTRFASCDLFRIPCRKYARLRLNLPLLDFLKRFAAPR